MIRKMFEWKFSPNINETFIDYHVASMNEPEFTFSQIYKQKKRKQMSNDSYPLIKLEYSLDLDNTFEKTLYERKTCVTWFKNKQTIDQEFISKFCNLAFIGGNRKGRAYPSGGGQYYVRIHILFNEKKVSKELIEFGNIGEVNCDTGNLMIKKYEPWKDIKTAFIQEYLANTAQFAIALSVNLQAISNKYHDISYKLVQQEAGHIGQNIQLVSQYLGFQSVPLGGFYDTVLNNLINEKQYVLYTFLLG